MYGAGAAKGKGKGKGKAKAPRSEGGQGHLLEKSRLSVEKFTGVVVAWKGKYGWIKPGEEIDHEKASLHNGDLFVGINDLDDGATSLEAGAPVEFHIFEDSSGLGAEEVVSTGPGNPDAPEVKAASKGSGKGGAAKGGSAKGGTKGAGWGYKGDSSWKGGDSWGGAAGYGGKGATKGGKAGWSLASGQAVYGGAKGVQTGYGGYGGKGADKGKGKGKDKGKTKSGAPRGQGHTLPRTRVSVEKFTGTVKSWKGKYGWIEPAEPIEHEKASKNKGALWVGMNDIEGAESLEEGATVEFHIFEDSSGLGVEEVVAF